jgi:type II secretory pathway component PulM
VHYFWRTLQPQEQRMLVLLGVLLLLLLVCWLLVLPGCAEPA